MQITITPAAERFMRRIVRFNGGEPGAGFRLQVKAGGCSGIASEFAVTAAPLAGDTVLDANGLALFLPAASALLLDGYTIDFSDRMQESGLTFTNPNAQPSACGTHHGAAPPVSTVAIASIRRKE